MHSRHLSPVIVATLGFALAAAVVVFSFLHTFLLRPLPFGDAARVAVIYEHSVKGGRPAFTRVTYANFTALRERTAAWSRLGLFRNESATFHGGEGTETAFVQRVTGEIFPLMGARAALGTVISPGNVEVGGIRSLLLSDSLWRRRFGADPTVVGRTVRLDATPFHVVGVMPAGFVVPTGDDNPQAWAALLPSDIVRSESTQRRHHVWAELAPGRTLAQADAELATLAAALRAELPKENADRTLFAQSLRDDLLGGFGRQLLLLQAAVLLVLVVACFNCLCLLIARAIRRRREYALRLALGAARTQLLAQLFRESLRLTVPAAVLALILAAFALPYGSALLAAGAQVSFRALPPPTLDVPVVAAVLGASLAVALLFSLVPLLQTRRLNLEATLREGGRSAGSASGTHAARWLAAGQIAVALALLICATLLLRSQRERQRTDSGLPLAELDQFRIGLRGQAYAADPALRTRFFERLRDELRALPGVRDVGVASFLFSTPPIGQLGFVEEGDGLELAETPKRALPCYVLPDTFSALGLRLIAGRLLHTTDLPGRPNAAVISASLAAKHWPNASPLGRRIRLQTVLDGAWFEVVGVVADVLGTGNQPRVVDTVYLNLAQGQPPGLGMGFLVRYAAPLAPGDAGIEARRRTYDRTLAQLDPTMQLFAHLGPAEIYARSAWQSRFVTQLVVAFAGLAVALAFAGLYAVSSFLVARRTHEFGIRSALGADYATLLRLVLRDNLRLAVLGLGVGLALAFGASQALTSLLFNVPTLDPLVYIAAALLMLAACAAATLAPARRAARTDPLIALRSE